MEKKSKKLSRRGGFRIGAGRKPNEGKAYTYTLQVRLSDAQKQTYYEAGGHPWLRRLLNQTERNQQASQAHPELPPVPSCAQQIAVPSATVRIPMVGANISCGFPSPASDYTSEDIDLNGFLVPSPDVSYIVRAEGDSMIDVGIFPGDYLVVDRSIEARGGDIVLALYDGSLTVKRLKFNDGAVELHPENNAADYPVQRPEDWQDLQILGVIVSGMTKYR